MNPNEIAPKSNPFTNSEPLRVYIVEAYTDELQPANPEKWNFSANQKLGFNSYTKN